MELIYTHARVTFSLMVREASTRYGSKPGGYLWALIDPVAHIVLLTLVFGAIARVPALGGSFSLFFATGYLPFMFFQTMQSYVSGAIKANRALLSYPIVSPFDTVVSRYMVQLLTSFLVMFCIFEVVIIEDGLSLSVDYAMLISSCMIGAMLGLGFGLSNIFLYARFPVYEQVFSLATRPLSLVSGLFFLPDSMAPPYRGYILYNPIAHIIMMFRQAVYPEYRAPGLDIEYLIHFTAIILIAGLILFTLGSDSIREERM